MIRVVHPGSGFFTHPGSRIQASKRHRIPDPQHCCQRRIIHECHIHFMLVVGGSKAAFCVDSKKSTRVRRLNGSWSRVQFIQQFLRLEQSKPKIFTSFTELGQLLQGRSQQFPQGRSQKPLQGGPQQKEPNSPSTCLQADIRDIFWEQEDDNLGRNRHPKLISCKYQHRTYFTLYSKAKLTFT